MATLEGPISPSTTLCITAPYATSSRGTSKAPFLRPRAMRARRDGGSLPGNVRPGSHQPGHRHRRRQDGRRAAGLHHRPGARAVIGTDAFQETDVVGLTLPITKWNCLVTKTEDLPRLMAQAFYIAAQRPSRPGAHRPSRGRVQGKTRRGSLSGPEQSVGPGIPPDKKADLPFEQVIEMLAASRRPVALVGAGAKWSQATPQVRELLDRLQIPAVSTVHGLGTIPEDRPYYLGMVGMHGTRQSNLAVSHSDLLLVLGARLDDRVTGDASRFARQAKIIHFEIDPAQLHRVRPCELPVVGDLTETVGKLLSVLPASHSAAAQGGAALPDWSPWLQETRATANPRQKNHVAGGKPSPTLLLDMLFDMIEPDALVTADVGQHQMWAAQRASGVADPASNSSPRAAWEPWVSLCRRPSARSLLIRIARSSASPATAASR